MSVGGSIESVSIRGRIFSVAADADAERKMGGFENEVQSNGDGTARMVKTRVPWVISGLTLDVDDVRADQEFLQEIADSKEFVTMTVTFCSGSTFEGEGTIVDEINWGSEATTADLTLSGPGSLNQQ